MAVVYKCDRCETVFDDKLYTGLVFVFVLGLAQVYEGGKVDKEEFHLCHECEKSLEDWYESGRKKQATDQTETDKTDCPD